MSKDEKLGTCDNDIEPHGIGKCWYKYGHGCVNWRPSIQCTCGSHPLAPLYHRPDCPAASTVQREQPAPTEPSAPAGGAREDADYWHGLHTRLVEASCKQMKKDQAEIAQLRQERDANWKDWMEEFKKRERAEGALRECVEVIQQHWQCKPSDNCAECDMIRPIVERALAALKSSQEEGKL